MLAQFHSAPARAAVARVGSRRTGIQPVRESCLTRNQKDGRAGSPSCVEVFDMSNDVFTAGAQRAIDAAARFAAEQHAGGIEPLHLFWGLLDDESHAAEILSRHNVRHDTLSSELQRPARSAGGGECVSEVHSADRRDVSSAAIRDERMFRLLETARAVAGRSSANNEIGTEHLLSGIVAADEQIAAELAGAGLDAKGLNPDLPSGREYGEPIRVDFELFGAPPSPNTDSSRDDRVQVPYDGRARPSAGPGDSDGQGCPSYVAAAPPRTLPNGRGSPSSCDADVLRIIDAAANRAREGLRVVEDYCRFALDDVHLTGRLKQCRHNLSTAIRTHAGGLLSARDTVHDVGTELTTATERERAAMVDVVRASFLRIQEAMRTLEEYGKVVSPELGAACKQIRYVVYTLEKSAAATANALERLAGRSLYLLVTTEFCRRDVETVVREAITGGVGVVQIREKTMPDRELLELCRRFRSWTSEGCALFIVNDRPDLALLADADGVHVGQDELTVRDARRIVGPHRLVGVSTHTIEQARQAVLDGADYLGVGPTFPSATKRFENFAGLDFVREVAAEISLPWYALGGIDSENLRDVVEAGAMRVAVTGAICGADTPREAAERLTAGLLQRPR